MIVRVAIVGPESTGKTTLSRDLAAHYATTWAPEYLRDWVDANPGRVPMVPFEATVEIARTHAAREDERAAAASRVVFFDTDALVSVVYSSFYLGRVHPELAALSAVRRPDRTLLLAPDVPWVEDEQRDLQHGREVMFEFMRDMLVHHKRPFDVISGTWAERRERAVSLVDGFLAATGESADPR